MDTARAYGQQLWNQSLGFVSSDGLVSQLVLTLIIVLVIHFVIVTIESIINGIKNFNNLSVTLFPYTYESKGNETSEQVAVQNPAGNDPFMYSSQNEVNGIEFSYSFHMYVDVDMYSKTPSTGATELRTVFYKGGEKPWPVLGPGVFLLEKENTMRIYMNTIADVADRYVEIPNIPVGKWLHVVITQKGQDMDVYINGNIAVRQHFEAIPRLNFGNLYMFPKTTATYDSGNTDLNVNITGPMQGMVSRLKYFAYSLSFSQIDSLYTEGPSKKIVSKSFDQTPPYFHDSWWVTRYNPMSSKYGL